MQGLLNCVTESGISQPSCAKEESSMYVTLLTTYLEVKLGFVVDGDDDADDDDDDGGGGGDDVVAVVVVVDDDDGTAGAGDEFYGVSV